MDQPAPSFNLTKTDAEFIIVQAEACTHYTNMPREEQETMLRHDQADQA